MIHEIYTITDFKITAPYTLRITFDDSKKQTIDFLPVLHGALFGPLRELAFFELVRLDAESGTLVWPNDADFDPATLHDWDSVGDAMIAMAHAWNDHIATSA